VLFSVSVAQPKLIAVSRKVFIARIRFSRRIGFSLFTKIGVVQSTAGKLSAVD
jgi:hypothetical protein